MFSRPVGDLRFSAYRCNRGGPSHRCGTARTAVLADRSGHIVPAHPLTGISSHRKRTGGRLPPGPRVGGTGNYGTKEDDVSYGHRLEVYLAQTGRANPTAAQRRRLMKKFRRFSVLLPAL